MLGKAIAYKTLVHASGQLQQRGKGVEANEKDILEASNGLGRSRVFNVL